ncbi:MAG TPA: response regulator [Polyangiaceae bacterium]|nr:response regulator [Polyangiaceae bacterium]
MTKQIRPVADWRPSDRRHSDVQPKAQHVRPKVLVVDDEPLIRLFVTRALKASGYDVVEAGSAERAKELLATDGSSLSLLLSDVGLPGVSGPELVEYAHRSFPNLPTQLMSATSKRWLVTERVLAEDVDLLQKPFKVADLLERLDGLMALRRDGRTANESCRAVR